jgi:hypothetical protein
LLTNSPGQPWKPHPIILIRGKVQSITKLAARSQPAHRLIGASAPRSDSAALSVASTAADKGEPPIGELIERSINAGSS